MRTPRARTRRLVDLLIALVAVGGLVATKSQGFALDDGPGDEIASVSYDSGLSRALDMYLVPEFVPQFTASPTEGTVPLEVAFVDRSQGEADMWLWSFGNGHQSPLQSPTQVYETPGIYTVTMYAWHDGSENAEHKRDYIWASFPDVPPAHWAFAPVLLCVGEGIVSGYPDGLYHPTSVVSRDQMAVYISRALADGDSHVPAGPPGPSFPDVSAEHWAFRHIEYAVSLGVVKGCLDGLYRPDSDLTRDQMAVFLARALTDGDGSVPLVTDAASFADVPTDHWAFRYVEYVRSEGVTIGYGDGCYRPQCPCERDQMAVFMQRAFGLPTAPSDPDQPPPPYPLV